MTESEQIQARYDELVTTCRKQVNLSPKDEDEIFRAFTLARNAHEGMRRKSGEPYIFHPLAVAQIAVEEVGLGPTAVICALLHDVWRIRTFRLTRFASFLATVWRLSWTG